mmetsp:Transcript_24816/g.27790  ORF Transcript_24816/g.27790 Transcript_24816/m.27790 type:complete len:178 (-) Transcript_24816:615-1148(-)|eukprot:CAMPEP_0170811386 /NCGR_PEP_ID=MMETSP0733-20121128/35230_1 /TAXON_ID=186038 /ORGANISM="Fragilariopsis kerguelensis, Strain L26-C5" /LENGTH=177 /DNA_ID=CAMNT_0011167539 /DNA_START=69 /DNA_END=602 /DNA_ORIENTATION=-
MTIRDINANDNSKNDRTTALSSALFASAPTEDQLNSTNTVVTNAEAVIRDDNNIPFVQATSVELLDQQSSFAEHIPIAYSTGKPPQPPPPPQQLSQPQSSSIAVATGAPTSTHMRNNARDNNQACCAGWTCCGITCAVLTSIFVCCVLPFVVAAIVIGHTAHSVLTEMDDEVWNIGN